MDEFLYDEFYRSETTHWWPVGMRKIFRTLLERALERRGDIRLLDVGCGTGISLEEFRRYGPIVGIDRSRRALEFARKRDATAAVLEADACHLPISGESLDVVLAFDVIEHLQDDRAALREMRRVLRPGGIALINVPAFPSLWSGKDDANHHFRRYTRPTLRAALVDSDLAIERLTYTNAALFPPIWLARQIERRLGRPWNARAEFHPRPWINATLLAVLDVERRLLARMDLSFGTSLTAIARRPRT